MLTPEMVHEANSMSKTPKKVCEEDPVVEDVYPFVFPPRLTPITAMKQKSMANKGYGHTKSAWLEMCFCILRPRPK